MLLLVNAYPQAVKKKMNDGRLPFEACVEKRASKDLMLALLEADMPLRIEDGAPVEHSGSWTACVSYDTACRSRILSMSEDGGCFGVHIHALADVCDAEGRTALGLASSGPRAAINKYRLFSRRYELQNGAPEHRTPTAVCCVHKILMSKLTTVSSLTRLTKTRMESSTGRRFQHSWFQKLAWTLSCF
jgi:hypothetical protein